MPERESNQDRYCRNCGVEVRESTSFCVSCGVAFAPESIPHDPPSESTLRSSSDEEIPQKEEVQIPPDIAGMSPAIIYTEYDRYRRFFREAREGLIRLSGELRDRGEDPSPEAPLTHNDLSQPLLHAQRGANKVEEYKTTLTTLHRDEASQREARTMLADLRQMQDDVLSLLESFFDKLEATEGYEEFKDEFARWYTVNLEP